ncbi:MAG TPA: NAD(+)--arginine ADP-ribosyltransferase, partial [Mycobacterium sp.]|nr:NAD(+)--arginine ADP-ribosyltransferase [Mycobacterium sp.]
LCSVGDGVRMSAHNYSLAEVMSNVGGQSTSLPVPAWTAPLAAGSPASSVGTGDSTPPGWGWVAPYIGMIWPTADSGKLRAAAAAWGAAGTKFGLAEIQGTAGPMGAIRAQQIPEGAAIDGAFSDAYSSTTSIVQQCQTIAAQLSSYAAKVDKVHAAILDLLARVCDPLTGIKEVWEFLTGEDEDEIKKVADDIRTVVDNFTAEVEALRGQIAAVLADATGVLDTMGDEAAKQWDQFLHGSVVGQLVNEAGQRFEGIGKEAFGMAKGLWEISQVRAVVDPIGYLHSMTEVSRGIAPLVGAAGGHGPGVFESWKELGKGITHWDDWKTNPGQALGKSEFDLATMFLPGGPVSKLGRWGRLARDGIRGKPPLPEPPPPPHELPRAPETPPLPRESVPREQPPVSSRPAPAPAGTPQPHSPTESKAPVPQKPAAGPARAPALPGEHPGEPAPGAAHLPGSAPTPSAPHAPHSLPRESMPTSGQPAEPSPHIGEPGGHSHHGALQSPDSSIEYPDAEPRTTISGHGAYYPDDGYMTVPQGTTLTVYAEHGSSITDELGNLIETGGDTSRVYSHTFYPGEQIPNYTIYPPDGLTVMGTPQTVMNPTRLTELVNEEMGDVHLAICPFDESAPTGIIYDVDGVFDQSTGVFTPYRRRGF